MEDTTYKCPECGTRQLRYGGPYEKRENGVIVEGGAHLCCINGHQWTVRYEGPFGISGVPGNEGTSCPGPGPQGPAQK